MDQTFERRWQSLTSAKGPTRRFALRTVTGLVIARLVGQNETEAKRHKKHKTRKKPISPPPPVVAPGPPPPSVVCPPSCQEGSLTVAPTAQGECRCVAVSPGLRDPAFACGGRFNANGEGCCFCLYTVEGDGFCAVNTQCDTIAAGSLTDCTSSGDCPNGRKCVVINPSFGDVLPAQGVCWPECHSTDGVTPVS